MRPCQGVLGALVSCPVGSEVAEKVSLCTFPLEVTLVFLSVPQAPIDHSDLVADLLKELSNHNERVEERKGALLELLKITREDSLGVWEEHFKTILLLLLETLGDKDVRNFSVPGFPAFSYESKPSLLGLASVLILILYSAVYTKTIFTYF